MNKIDQAKKILKSMGLSQQNEVPALTLLALCGITPKDDWSKATRNSLKVGKGIKAFIKKEYKKEFVPEAGEPVYREILLKFIQAFIVDQDPDNLLLPVNSPKAHYMISEVALEVIRTYKTENWEASLNKFLFDYGVMSKKFLKEHKRTLIPVKLNNNKIISFSNGKQSKLQQGIIQLFAPRLLKGAEILYIKGAAKKDTFSDETTLNQLHIPLKRHSKLPDIISYERSGNKLYLIESVNPNGPVTSKKVKETEELFKDCTAHKIYVSAFQDFSDFNKHSSEIAWDTFVWIMEVPEHTIHFDGRRFPVTR